MNRSTPTSRRQTRQVNESAILRAAERVFARAGFEGATMADIADEAGLPKANLHYYFGAKRALYRAVLDAVLHDWLAPLDAITPEADPRTALRHYIELKMALAAERPHASRVFANELLHGAPRIPDHPYWRYSYPGPTWRSVRASLPDADPEQDRRALDDRKYALDHFQCKLLRLPETMQTDKGKAMAQHNARFLVEFMAKLSAELQGEPLALDEAVLRRFAPQASTDR